MAKTESVEQLVTEAVCSAAEAPRRVPSGSGYYAIFVNEARTLPSPFCELLEQQATKLIYIGIATESLFKRLVEQDLKSQGPSTFFRGIGGVLGYRPPLGSLVGKANQNNYKFSAGDTARIVGWINQHLAVNWFEVAPAVAAMEATLIRRRRPFFNTTHNPDPVAELAATRSECRRIAGMDGRRGPG